MTPAGAGEHPGVPAAGLDDDDLERELLHAHEMRHDTLVNGTAHALRNHSERTSELEREYLRRHVDRVVEAADKAALYTAR